VLSPSFWREGVPFSLFVNIKIKDKKGGRKWGKYKKIKGGLLPSGSFGPEGPSLI